RVLGGAGAEGLRRVGTFFLLGELAYAVIYMLSPGYVLTGYQYRHAPFSVFFTCVIPAMAVYVLVLTMAQAWKWLPGDKEVRGVPDFPNSRFDELLPGFIGGGAAAAAVFFCAYWAAIQLTYIRLLPPDHFSFLKELRQPPYLGKSFVVNNYAAPVAVMAGAWAYFDPLMTNGWKNTGRGYE